MNEISKNLQCVAMRNGVEIWIEQGRVENFKKTLQQMRQSTFVELPEGQVVNTADIVGIFQAQDMEEARRKSWGQWKDKTGNWHDKGERVCPRHPDNTLQGFQTCGLCQ